MHVVPHRHRTRSSSSSSTSTSTSSPSDYSPILIWLGRYALPLLFLLGLVLIGVLMVKVIIVLSAPPQLGLVTGRGTRPAGVLLR